MSSNRFESRLISLLVPALLLSAACGGDGEPAPKTPADVEVVEERRRADGMQSSSEIGGLNEEEVEATFKKSLAGLQKCLGEGAERVEFLGGSIAFFIKIGKDGEVSHAHLEKSSLGDRKTEKCMMAALRARSWPKPIGGDQGIARKSFEFDPPNDVRPPTEWSGDQVASALEKIQEQIGSCKASVRGEFEATVYVNTDGTVLSASVTPPDEEGEQAVDCLVGALSAAEFDSPGSWPAKVTFSL